MSVETRIPTDAEVKDPRQLSLIDGSYEVTAVRREEDPWLKHTTPEALAKAEKAEQEEQGAKEKERPKLGQVIRLPAKTPEDSVLRLEQNLGCELPVCVSNRKEVGGIAIEMTVDGTTLWRLERTASSLLPAPEHYPLWLWFLDRCQAAAKAGYKTAPRIVIDPAELQALFGGNKNGEWYKNIDEAFWRFSHLVVEVSTGFCERTKQPVGRAVLGTLCHYASWRKNPDSKELENAPKGWVAPGPLLWASIRDGYLKAIPMQTMRELPSYVAQRLLTYLAKHCRPGESFKISLAKLLPKIPLGCPTKEAKRRLRQHHKTLSEAGFLASEPVFEGRGTNLMVTYERTPLLSP